MLPTDITIKGITSAHVRALTLHLGELPDGLIAVIGPNGSGKTTLLEALGPLSLFGRSPSRECGISNLAIAGDSLIELQGVHGGRRWTVTRKLDAGLGKHEGFLAIDDIDQNTGGRVNDLRDLVGRLFLPPALYLASIYAAQHGKGSFVGLKEAERRDLFAALLGIGALQVRSEEASGIAKASADALGEIDRRIAEARAVLDRFSALKTDEDGKAAEFVELTERRELLAADHQRLRDEARDLGNRIREARAVVTSATERSGRALAAVRRNREAIDAAGDRLVKENTAAENLDGLRVELQGAEAAEARVSAAASALEVARGRLATLEATASTLRAKIRNAEEALARLDRLVVVRSALTAERTRLGELETEGRARVAAHEEAGALLAQAREAEAAAVLAHTTATGDHQRAVARLEAEIRSLTPQAALLDRVPCGGRLLTVDSAGEDDRELGEHTWERVDCGSCELLGSARDAGERLPLARAELEEIQATHADRIEPLLVALTQAKALTRERLGDEEVKRRARDEARAAYRELKAGIDARAAQIPEDLDAQIEAQRTIQDDEGLSLTRNAAAQANAREEVGDAEAALATVKAANTSAERVGALRAQVRTAEASATAAASTRATLETLEARAVELHMEDEAAKLALTQAELTLEGLAGLDPDERIREAQARAVRAGEELEACQVAERAASAALSELRGALSELSAAETRIARLQARREELEGIHARHELLALSLGRKGVQAHEIDGAGPLVSGLVNDLLEACYGPRFRVELITQQEGDGRKKEREVFELRIWDGQRGDRRSFDDLSGGEKVLIDEALKLALALLTTRRSGIRCGALFRDEADGALDDDNAERFPAMLRRAMDLGGFRRVFFVSHRSEVYTQADGVIGLKLTDEQRRAVSSLPVLEGA